MKRFLALSIFVCIVGLTGPAYAPDIEKFKVYVSITVGKETKTEGDIIERTIKSELRAFGDIEIVEILDDWQFIITIHASVVKYENGTKYPNILITSNFFEMINKSRLKPGDSFDSGPAPVYLSIPNASFWPRKNLITWCKLEVHKFNKDTLAFHRLVRIGKR